MGQKGHRFDKEALRHGADELTHEAQILTRDVVTAPFRLKTYRLIRKILIGFILVSIANVLFSYFFYTPKMYRILRDNRETVIRYRILQDRIRTAQRRVDEIRHRDSYVYRSLFSTDTLSLPGIWQPYPASKYAPLEEDEFAPLMISTWRQLDAAEPGRLRVTVQPGRYQPVDHSVEGDWSGASYLLGAGALGAAPVRVEGLRADSLQGDRAMLAILRDMGARLSIDVGAVTVEPSALRGIDVDMGACPDLVPTVAVLAAAAHGTTRIRNVAHLRIKESDRITAPAQELARVGVRVDPQEDGLVVHGLGADVLAANVRALSSDACFQAHNDHRIAMSLALLSLLPGVSLSLEDRIDDPRVVAKSFPHFWRLWEALR